MIELIEHKLQKPLNSKRLTDCLYYFSQTSTKLICNLDDRVCTFVTTRQYTHIDGWFLFGTQLNATASPIYLKRPIKQKKNETNFRATQKLIQRNNGS